MRLGIALYVRELRDSYSVAQVALSQCGLALEAGWDPELIVRRDFSLSERLAFTARLGAKIRAELPLCHTAEIKPRDPKPENWDELVSEAERALATLVESYDALILHDFACNPYLLSYTDALRRVAPRGRVLLPVHSLLPARSNTTSYPYRLMFEPISGATYLVPSATAKKALKRALGVEPVVLPNFIEIDEVLRLTPEAWQFAKWAGWDLAQIRICWPFDLSRARSKGLWRLFDLFLHIRKFEPKTSLALLAGGADYAGCKGVKEKIAKTARTLGLTSPPGLALSWEFKQEWEKFVPRRVVLSLLRLSDLFIFPGKDEAGSLALLEAMACGLPIVSWSDCELAQEWQAGPFRIEENGHLAQYARDIVEYLRKSSLANRQFCLSQLSKGRHWEIMEGLLLDDDSLHNGQESEA